MKKSRLFACALALTASAQAQQLFPDFLEPTFRNLSSSEYSQWDFFFTPYTDPNDPLAETNHADVASAASDPTLSQILNPDAFVTSGFNIYSFSGPTGFSLANNLSSTLASPLTNVVLQFDTLGTAIDLNSIRLNYSGGSLALGGANVITEYRIITGGFGGFTNRTAVQWDLTGLGISDYTITFESLGSSNSFNAAVLDVSTATYSELVPSARTWDGGASDGKWSSTANWSNDTVTSLGGNVTFGPASGATVDLDSNREVGELRLSRPGGFTLTRSNGATLTTNTGIVVDASGAGDYAINAPIFMGGHNFVSVGSDQTLTLSGAISGAGAVETYPGSGINYPAVGLYKEGAGKLILSGNNDFTGGLTVDGGTLVVSGVNQYAGATTVVQGELTLQGHAPSGAAGTLGNSTGNVGVGVDPATYGALPAAALIVDGDFTVARNVALASGTNAKVLGARHTTAGATFSGSVTLTASASEVFLRAEAASDTVTFSGQVTGGGITRTLTKDGAGTVIFSGVNKTYANATTIAAGTLQIASGTALTGNGKMTVASGATLLVHGSLEGSGELAVNRGTLGGTGSIGRTFSLDAGDVLSPGASVGTLNTIGETWAGGGRLRLEINDVDAGVGLGWDFVNITGALSLTATSGGKFTLELDSLTLANTAGLVGDFNSASDYAWKFLSASGGITGFSASAFAFDTSGFQNMLNGSFAVSQSGNDLILNYTAVPEPASALLFFSGAVVFLNRRRRVRRIA